MADRPKIVSFEEARNKLRRRRNKAKADAAFDKQYSSQEHSSQDAEGPRAAVYTAGKTNPDPNGKPSFSLQDAVDKIGEFTGRAAEITEQVITGVADTYKRLPKFAAKLITVAACIALIGVFLYTPAQQCYNQIRERDRLAAEYAAVEDRNARLQGIVDSLQTDAGIEDKAHAEFGLIKEGEEAGSVTGMDLDDTSKFTATVVPGSISPPDTWYSGFLDFFFGYSG